MKSIAVRSLITFALIAMSAIGAYARTLHVSPAPLPRIAVDQQFRTISEAAAKIKPGDTVEIHTGVYRETVNITVSGTSEKPIIFQAAQGARVVVTGADVMNTFTRESGEKPIYGADWPYDFAEHPSAGPAPINRCEQVISYNYLLTPVLTRDQMGPNTFCADLVANRLYVWLSDGDNPNIILTEVSTRNVIWICSGAYVHTKGMIFRYAANRAQQGAVLIRGAFDIMEDCISERTNGSGAAFGKDVTIRRCTFQDHGQIGFGSAGCHRLHMIECVIRNNNTKNVNRSWEAGGCKICMARDVLIEKCQFLDNHGTGLGFDIGNENCVVRNCLIKGNENYGLFYEISYNLRAYDNVIIANGYAVPQRAWGTPGGIGIYCSPGCVVERNLIAGNMEGIHLRERGPRTTMTIEDKTRGEHPISNHDELIQRNLIAYNQTQTWGWFKTDDGRYLPKAMQTKPSKTSFEKLKFTLRNNIYYAAPGQNLFIWATGFPPFLEYSSLDLVRKQLNLEQSSRVEQVKFANFAAGDLRVPANSLAIKMGCYPKGTVPGVKLGIMPTK